MKNENLEKFLEFESKYKLFNENINGFYFWIYIRFDVMEKINQKLGCLNKGQNSSTFGDSYKEKVENIFMLIYNSINYRIRLKFLKNRDILIIDHPRKVKNEKGLYECKYTKEIYKRKKDQSYLIEFPNPYKHCYPSKNKEIIYMDYVRIYTALNKKLFANKYRLNDKQRDLLSNIITKVNNEFKIDINEIEFIKFVENIYARYEIEKKLLYRFLRKINPKKVIEVVYYSIDNLIINEIATELNIETIEFQHGIMGYNHCAYNFKKKQNIPQFPNKILTFSEFWKKTTRLPIKDEDVIPVGFPYFENRVNKYKQNLNLKEKNDKKKILFISQASIGDKLVKLACELNNIIDNEKYEIIYKLHPGEFSIWKEKYKELRNYSIKTIANEIDLYELFSKSSIQVGAYSTAIYEGLGFGLDTYIYQIYGTNIFEDLCKEGFITYINSANELKIYLERKSTNKKMNEEYLWKKDSLNNIIKEIEK